MMPGAASATLAMTSVGDAAHRASSAPQPAECSRKKNAAAGRSVAAPRRPDGRVAALWPQLPEVDGRPAPSSWAGTGAGDRDGRGPLLYNRAPAPVIRRSARSLSSVPTPLPAHYWEIPITYKLSTGLSLPGGVVRLINLQELLSQWTGTASDAPRKLLERGLEPLLLVAIRALERRPLVGGGDFGRT